MGVKLTACMRACAAELKRHVNNYEKREGGLLGGEVGVGRGKIPEAFLGVR
jgi:hypothetical protein